MQGGEKTTKNKHPFRAANEKKNTLRELWGNMKYHNICFIGVPEGAESERVIKNLLE